MNLSETNKINTDGVDGIKLAFHIQENGKDYIGSPKYIPDEDFYVDENGALQLHLDNGNVLIIERYEKAVSVNFYKKYICHTRHLDEHGVPKIYGDLK